MLAEAGGGRRAVKESGQWADLEKNGADLEKNESIVREQQGNGRPW